MRPSVPDMIERSMASGSRRRRAALLVLHDYADWQDAICDVVDWLGAECEAVFTATEALQRLADGDVQGVIVEGCNPQSRLLREAMLADPSLHHVPVLSLIWPREGGSPLPDVFEVDAADCVDGVKAWLDRFFARRAVG